MVIVFLAVAFLTAQDTLTLGMSLRGSAVLLTALMFLATPASRCGHRKLGAARYGFAQRFHSQSGSATDGSLRGSNPRSHHVGNPVGTPLGAGFGIET